jgi:hypothetical protein
VKQGRKTCAPTMGLEPPGLKRLKEEVGPRLVESELGTRNI